jgi:hypothetical protein
VALAAVSAVFMAVGLGACGVSASSEPRVLGTAYAPVTLPDGAQSPPGPTAAKPEDLVHDYLSAAAGGGEAAVNQVRAYLTADGRKRWLPPDKNAPGIRIIRVISVGAKAQVDLGTPVDLTFRDVGTLLNDEGRLVPATNTQEQTVEFQVVRATDALGQLRIDSGPLPGLVLSDQALNVYYRPQPIYFWDANNQVLVPDLRYVPLTLPPDQRAYKIVGWLLKGPSQLLGTDAVNTLPINTSYTVVPHDSSLAVKLSPQAGGKGPDDVHRLVWQLQASLVPVIGDPEVWIGNTQVEPTGSASDYRQFDLSADLPVPMHKYDIVDGVVKIAPGTDVDSPAPNLPMLTAKENSQVVYAAISRDDSYGALVRRTDPSPSLVLLPNAGKAIPVRGLPRSDQVSRPAWIPGVDGLLVAWGGALYLVDESGRASVVAAPGLGPISSVAISPDGRRVALLAGGQVTIAVIAATNTPTGPSVHLEGQPQTLAADPGLVAYGVAWESEQEVAIVGQGGDGGPALWEMTTDGAFATNLSTTLKNVVPVDVVAYPQGAFNRGNQVEVVVLQADPGLPYRSGSNQVILDGTKRPFYVD